MIRIIGSLIVLALIAVPGWLLLYAILTHDMDIKFNYRVRPSYIAAGVTALVGTGLLWLFQIAWDGWVLGLHGSSLYNLLLKMAIIFVPWLCIYAWANYSLISCADKFFAVPMRKIIVVITIWFLSAISSSWVVKHVFYESYLAYDMQLSDQSLGYLDAQCKVFQGSVVLNAICAAHPNASLELLARLATNDSAKVRANVAANLSTPSGVLVRLANDPDVTVRSRLLENSHIPWVVLKKLQNDPDKVVAGLAKLRFEQRNNEYIAVHNLSGDVLKKQIIDYSVPTEYQHSAPVAQNIWEPLHFSGMWMVVFMIGVMGVCKGRIGGNGNYISSKIIGINNFLLFIQIGFSFLAYWMSLYKPDPMMLLSFLLRLPIVYGIAVVIYLFMNFVVIVPVTYYIEYSRFWKRAAYLSVFCIFILATVKGVSDSCLNTLRYAGIFSNPPQIGNSQKAYAYGNLLAANDNASPEILRELFYKYDYAVSKAEIAANLNTPNDILLELSKSKEKSVQTALVDNPNIGCEILKSILGNADEGLKSKINRRISCSTQYCLSTTENYRKVANVCTGGKGLSPEDKK